MASSGGQATGATTTTPVSPSSVPTSSSSPTVSSSSTTTTPTTSTTPTTNVGQSPATLTTSPSPSISSPAASASSFDSNQNTNRSASTNSSQSSTSSTTTPTSLPNTQITSNNRLSNGVVAGIVIGVALGLALLTFLATFVIMRRHQRSKNKRSHRVAGDNRRYEMDPTTTRKKPTSTEANGPSATYEDYLPQSADDKTIQQRTQSTLDQIELYIENFYGHSSSSAVRPDNAELAKFDSPYLPASLASLLARSKNRRNIMKHALAQSVTSSISPSASPARSLLPAEYTLLPNTVDTATSAKAGLTQIISRWRVMTAYLRPDPLKDAAYIAQRDRQISDIVRSFAKAFAPWKSTGYKDEERAHSLSAILEDAADLGIFLFSEPSTLKFHWPAAGEVRSGRIIISPALLKTTDEKGRDLVEAKVMVDQVVFDA